MEERELSVQDDEEVDRRQRLEVEDQNNKGKKASLKKKVARQEPAKPVKKSDKKAKLQKKAPSRSTKKQSKKPNRQAKQVKRKNGKNGGFLDFLCSFLSAIPGLSSILSMLPTSIIEQVPNTFYNPTQRINFSLFYSLSAVPVAAIALMPQQRLQQRLQRLQQPLSQQQKQRQQWPLPLPWPPRPPQWPLQPRPPQWPLQPRQLRRRPQRLL